MFSDRDARPATSRFYPPRIEAPAKLPHGPRLLVRLLSDSIGCIPEAAYHEPVVFVRRPPAQYVVYVSDPDLIKVILLDKRELFPKPELQRRALGPLAGTGLLLAEGDEWRWQRQLAAPALRQTQVLSHVPTMVAYAEAQVARWKAAPDGTIHQIDEDMVRVAFDVLAGSILAGSRSGAMRAIAEGYTRYFAGVTWTFLYALLRLPGWVPQPGGSEMCEHRRRMRGAVRELVRSRLQQQDRGDDLLGRLLSTVHPETGEAMSETQIVDNVLTFMIAGHDTTARTLAWTLYLIAKSPDWEARMLAEIEAVAGGEPISGAHIGKLQTVSQVLKEAMRLFPSFPETSRVSAEAIELGGHRLKAGTFINIPIYAIHRHRKLWDDPDRFDPGRFAPEHAATHSRYQFMPFGGGPRVCVGAAYAMTEATALLATFVRAVHFEAPPGFEPVPVARLSLLPKNGMPLRVSMRRHFS